MDRFTILSVLVALLILTQGYTLYKLSASSQVGMVTTNRPDTPPGALLASSTPVTPHTVSGSVEYKLATVKQINGNTLVATTDTGDKSFTVTSSTKVVAWDGLKTQVEIKKAEDERNALIAQLEKDPAKNKTALEELLQVVPFNETPMALSSLTAGQEVSIATNGSKVLMVARMPNQ